jgi:hypothetical protein
MTDNSSLPELIPLSQVAAEIEIPIDLLMVWYKRKRWSILLPINVAGVDYVNADEYRCWSRHLRDIIIPALRPKERARCGAWGLKASGARERLIRSSLGTIPLKSPLNRHKSP